MRRTLCSALAALICAGSMELRGAAAQAEPERGPAAASTPRPDAKGAEAKAGEARATGDSPPRVRPSEAKPAASATPAPQAVDPLTADPQTGAPQTAFSQTAAPQPAAPQTAAPPTSATRSVASQTAAPQSAAAPPSAASQTAAPQAAERKPPAVAPAPGPAATDTIPPTLRASGGAASAKTDFRSQLQPQSREARYEPLSVGRRERLLIIAPHPDDETLGAGGLAERVLAQGGVVTTVVVTAGDGYVEAVQLRTRKAHPQPWEFLRYGERRIREAESAAHLLSGGRIHLDVLGFPDGGLLPLLAAHWAHLNPGRSLTTQRESPPYAGLKDRGEVYAGHDLRSILVSYLQKLRPTLIAFTDPLDQHPDHRAVGLFALLSVSDYMRKRRPPWPRMLAWVVHYDQWPFDPDGETASRTAIDAKFGYPQNFPVRNQTRSCLTLTDAELKQKQLALGEYRTQQKVMAPFLEGFVRRNECFSLNTEIDATFAGREIGIAEDAAPPAPQPQPTKKRPRKPMRVSKLSDAAAKAP